MMRFVCRYSCVRGKIAPKTDERWVTAQDIGPTLLALHGLPQQGHCRGGSLLNPAKNSDVFGTEGFRARAVIWGGRYKYIRNYAVTNKRFYRPGVWAGEKIQTLIPEQLYDLQEDPTETTNLVDSQRELLVQARQIYHDYYNEQTRYELVLEAKGKFYYRFGQNGESVPGEATDRVLLSVVPPLQEVFIDDRPVPVLQTRHRLPSRLSIQDLPLEMPGPHPLQAYDSRLGPIAYIRRVATTNIRARTIVSTNEEFDAVLREWGYLNDQ